MLLTRDARLATRRGAAVAATYVLEAEKAGAQLREVAARWGLAFNATRAMSRCAVCNSASFAVLQPAAAQALVPEIVFQVRGWGT